MNVIDAEHKWNIVLLCIKWVARNLISKNVYLLKVENVHLGAWSTWARRFSFWILFFGQKN